MSYIDMTKKQLISELRNARLSEREYADWLTTARAEIEQLKKERNDAAWRAEVMRNYLNALKHQAMTISRIFGLEP